jgi:hypothetical protein
MMNSLRQMLMEWSIVFCGLPINYQLLIYENYADGFVFLMTMMLIYFKVTIN